MPKLLLADDSVTIQRVIELTFADEQIQVIAVGDGQQAIDKIEADKPDIVLADVGMPERDGYEVAAHVKGSPQLAHIPVILLTGAFEPIDEARARAVGCDGVLVKPFEPQMVINRVKDLLSGRRTTSLWAAAPAPAAAVPAAAAQRGSAAAPETAATTDSSSSQPIESLDEYFDRLDAAFSHAETSPAAPQQAAAATPPERALSKAERPAPSKVEGPAPSKGEAPARSKVEGAVPGTADFGDWDITIDRHTTERSSASSPAASREKMPDTSQPARPAAVPAQAAPARAVPPPAPSRAEAQVPNRPEAPAPSRVEAAVSTRIDAPALADAFAALLAAEQGQVLRQSAGPAPTAAVGSPAPLGAGAVSDAQIEDIVRKVLARMTDQVVRQTVLPIAEQLVREEIDRVKKGTS